MISNDEIRLARPNDAVRIAEMSRSYIESGLGWSWTPVRVVREITSKSTNVIVAVDGTEVAGFAIMKYLNDEARLNLFAVHPKYRRRGIGTRMIKWLEKTALINGNRLVYLEVRQGNRAARKFYESLGYAVIQHIPGYYRGREAAIRMTHDLWPRTSSE